MAEEQVRTRHRGKLNVAFCDGHTLGIKVHGLLFDHSDAALRRWNNDHEPHRELLSP
jgi:prepilin-type processing-associated H-X9-DG protein